MMGMINNMSMIAIFGRRVIECYSGAVVVVSIVTINTYVIVVAIGAVVVIIFVIIFGAVVVVAVNPSLFFLLLS